MVKLKELKEKCDKNQSVESPEKTEMMKQLGFQNNPNPDFLLERKTIGKTEKWGDRYATGGFCLTQKLTFQYGDSRFNKILGLFKDQQDKTPNTWKLTDGGLGFDKGKKSWCSNDPNSVIPMVSKLKNAGYTVCEDVKSCDLLNGVPKDYLKLDLDKYDISNSQPSILEKKEPEEKKEIIIPKIEEPKDKSKVTIQLQDKC